MYIYIGFLGYLEYLGYLGFRQSLALEGFHGLRRADMGITTAATTEPSSKLL